MTVIATGLAGEEEPLAANVIRAPFGAQQRVVSQAPAMAVAGGSGPVRPPSPMSATVGKPARAAASFTAEPVPFSRPPARTPARGQFDDLDIPTFIRRQMD